MQVTNAHCSVCRLPLEGSCVRGVVFVNRQLHLDESTRSQFAHCSQYAQNRFPSTSLILFLRVMFSFLSLPFSVKCCCVIRGVHISIFQNFLSPNAFFCTDDIEKQNSTAICVCFNKVVYDRYKSARWCVWWMKHAAKLVRCFSTEPKVYF